MEQYITLVGKVCAPRYENVFTPEVRSELPIEASSEGRHLKDWAIYGNNRPNHIDETQNNLPIEVSAYGGNATDWEIYGNDNPVVRDDTGVLPMEIGSNGDELTDYTIYGNNNPVVEEEQKILPMELSATAGNVRDWEIYGNNDPVVENKAGVLPIEASATAGNVLDWTIYGNNDVGKNIFSLADFVDVNKNNVVMAADKGAGLVSVYTTDTPTANTQGTISFFATVTGNYLMSGIPSNAPNLNIQIYCWDSAASARAKAWDRTSDSLTCNKNNTEVEVYLEAGKQYSINVRVLTSYGTQAPITISPMVRLDGTSSTFEPYTVGVGERTENLYDYDNAEITDWIINASGQQQTTPEYRYRTQYITVIPSGVYTFRWAQAVQPGTSTPYIRICFFNSETFISRSVINGVTTVSKTVAITMPANCNKILVQCDDKTSKNGQYFVDIMLVEGSTAPESFIPYGYEVPLYIRHKTKNLYQLPKDATSNGVTFTGDSTDGTVTANGTNPGSTSGSLFYEITNYPDGDYYLSGCADGGSTTTYNIHIFDTTTSNRAVSWDETTISDRCYSMSQQIPVHLYSSHSYRITIQVASGYTVDNIVFKPMLRPADTTPDFEPYYLSNHEDIYIGNSPLTQGQSITKTQSGQDVTLFSGDNIIDTSLYNKPNTSITYNSSVLGVGERTVNLFDKNATDTNNGYVDSSYITNTGTTLSSGNWNISEYIDVTPATTYIFCRGTESGASVSYAEYDNALTFIRAVPYGGERNVVITTSPNTAKIRLSIYRQAIDSTMLIKGSTAPTTYIPFGYQIPLSVTSGQTTTPYNYYIGNSPLTAGQSISKTSTGTDIALLSGTNTISTTMGNKPEMRVKYNSSVLGVGERTKNLLEITAENQTIGGVTFTVDKAAGTITLNGDTSQQTSGFSFVVATRTDLDGTYLLSGGADGGSSTSYDLYMYDAFDQRFSERCYDSDDVVTFNCVAGHTTKIYIQCRKNYVYNNVVFKPMLRAADTTPDFIPWGYQIPVLVTGGRTENLFDIDASTMVQIDSQGNLRYGVSIGSALAGTYTLSFTNTGVYPIYVTTRIGTTYSRSSAITVSPHTITLANNVDELIIRATSSYMTTWEGLGFTNIMLVEGSTAPDHYIPYHNTTQTNIYVGTSPLTQGQSINKATSQVDIDMYEDENVIDVAIDNKPQMNMVYNSDIMGVGEWNTPQVYTGWEQGSRTTSAQGGETYSQVKTSSTTRVRNADLIPVVTPFYYEINSGYQIGATFFDENGLALGTSSNVAFRSTPYTYTGVGKYVSFAIKNDAGTDITPSSDFVVKIASPYGYQIPLSVTSGQTTTPYNYFIGNAPLTAGQSISKTSTSTDIALLSGTNTISTTMGNKPEMRIDYESTEVGVGVRTKNYVNVETGTTSAGVTFTFDPATGTVTANGTATGRDVNFMVLFNSSGQSNNSTVPLGNYYFSGCPNGGGGETYNCYSWDNDTNARSKQWNGVTDVETDSGQGNCQVLINGHRQSITLRIRNGYTANNVVFKPMLRKADTTSEFEPYGYKVPVKVYDDEDNSETYDVYIGSQLLVSGASVNKDGTGVDIELNEGANTIKTDLYNEPEMYIK